MPQSLLARWVEVCLGERWPAIRVVLDHGLRLLRTTTDGERDVSILSVDGRETLHVVGRGRSDDVVANAKGLTKFYLSRRLVRLYHGIKVRDRFAASLLLFCVFNSFEKTPP